MARRAFILGGTGQIGLALAERLLAADWDVTLASRTIRPLPDRLVHHGVKQVTVDRDIPGELPRALGSGADAVIDVVAYDPAHGRQLLAVQQGIGHLVVISSSSVYRDDLGRTLDEAAQNGFPDFPEPIGEAQPTVAPGDETYSTRKVALERIVLDKATIPVTILRPAAIYGLGSTHPREWWFVKRILDSRRTIPLAYEGRSRFHTSSVLNIAELTRIALDRPETRVLNIADPSAPSVAEIGTMIARHMGYAGRLLKLDDDTYPARVGRTPWSVPRPFTLDNGAATALGYRAVTDYAGSIGTICDELTGIEPANNWRKAFPVLARYSYDHFDYEVEDQFLARRDQRDV